MLKKYQKTNLFVIDEGLWSWAKYQASLRGFNSVSEYMFELLKFEKDAFSGEIHEVQIGENEYYLAIGRPETSESAGIHFMIDEQIIRPYLGKKVILIIKEAQIT